MTHDEVKVPFLLGLIATRSLDTPVPGIKELIAEAEAHIHTGLKAYKALIDMRAGRGDRQKEIALLQQDYNYLGYALLLKALRQRSAAGHGHTDQRSRRRHHPRRGDALLVLRAMVGLGLYFIGLFAVAFYYASIHRMTDRPRFLKFCFYSLPLPWIAAELGWIVAEYGRQPWAIEGILPTFLGVSSVSGGQVAGSLAGFIIFYTALLVVDIYLMVKYIRIGPGAQLAPKGVSA